MSSFLQKIRKAVVKRNTFNLTSQHLTSAEFMQNNVIYSDYVVPTDKFRITPVFEGRCAALQNPSFINTEYHVRGFYVPHSIVWKRFDDFVNGNYTLKDGQHLNTGCPVVTDRDLTLMFVNRYTVPSPIPISSSDIVSKDYSHEVDFILPNTGEDGQYYGFYFTTEGRFVYKLLRSLGYKMNFVNDVYLSNEMNAFPILSYFRIFLDYFVPSLYYNTSACNLLLSHVYDTSTNSLNICQNETAVGDLFKQALDEVYRCYYPSDYLTSVWSQPQSPLGSAQDNKFSQLGIVPEFSEILKQTSGSNNLNLQNADNNGVESTGINSLPNSQSTVGNPWVQRNLQKIADWLTRTRFSGSDKLINILTRFGVKPDNVQLLRSRMVGHFTQPLIVQDINATSTTYARDPETQKDIVLGEYAGKMFTQAQNNRSFEFDCDDYGCIIITSMITPKDINYFEGISRNVLKTQPLQWFQPEFDSMGTQLVSRRELVSGLTFDIPQFGMENYVASKTYGYVPRYAEYKHAMSNISGDFMVNHLNLGYDSYHHMRSLFKIGRYRSDTMVDPQYNTLVPNTGSQDDVNGVSLGSNPELLDANRNLLIKAQDANQYNRIFNVQDNTIDHIYTMYYFNVSASRPMGSIADSIDIDDGQNDLVDTHKPVVENFN